MLRNRVRFPVEPNYKRTLLGSGLNVLGALGVIAILIVITRIGMIVWRSDFVIADKVVNE